jgi:hypothetical protein
MQARMRFIPQYEAIQTEDLLTIHPGRTRLDSLFQYVIDR